MYIILYNIPAQLYNNNLILYKFYACIMFELLRSRKPTVLARCGYSTIHRNNLQPPALIYQHTVLPVATAVAITHSTSVPLIQGGTGRTDVFVWAN